MASHLDDILFAQAKRYLVGGVNSPVRSFKSVGLSPVFIRRAKGARLYAEDGSEFIDYCLSFGAHLLGHGSPEVAQALREVLESGVSFGAATKRETELAKLIAGCVPSVELLRLTNSGTEAVMGVIRLARAYTRRDKVVKFGGCYHGHADYLLECGGIPRDFKKHTLTCGYNDLGGLKNIFKKHGGRIAGVIVEPVAANMGVVLPKAGFLEGIREIVSAHESVLIFDEVITGFRLGLAGAQGFFGVKPDLSCFGKIIGGGLPIGAFGGRRRIMKLLAPEGPVYQAGTFSGNPVSVAAGLVVLKTLRKKRPYAGLAEKTDRLCRGTRAAAERAGIKVRVNNIASLFSVFFTGEEVVDFSSAKRQDTRAHRRFYRGLLNEGVYFSPSCFEANFVSTAHTSQDILKTAGAAERVFGQMC